VHTYGIIKIKDSLHHTIAKLEHCFTIAFSGAFLAFFSAKRVMTLSKLIFLAIWVKRGTRVSLGNFFQSLGILSE
jgi:hypothetical protein